jgi:hypothetical protein
VTRAQGRPPEFEPRESDSPADWQDDAAAARTLGGYEVLRLLGKGGMGTVFLARQISLGRPVALKVMHPRWARDRSFLARFSREAYAAAQLVHSNIVQIYDIGEDKGIHFFSMEYVPGPNLAELVRRDGPLDAAQAAGYVLQAARGLKIAHDRGMVHRDVKPDNLLLSESGVVKLTDLGLVKIVGSDDPMPDGVVASAPNLTAANVTVGTAAFMAPEQARGPSAVDHRADIYALGCTFYALLTGHAPFAGHTAMEVITRHCCEPVVAPEVRAPGVPRVLSALILRMLAKKPEDRYPSLAPVIHELEQFLGGRAGGTVVPGEEHLSKLEACARRFQSPTANLRRQVRLGVYACLGLAALLCGLAGAFRVAAFVGALAGLTALASFAMNGIVYRRHLFCQLRELLLESSWRDRLLAAGAAALALALLVAVLRPGGAAAVLVLAAGWALSLHVLLDRRVARERRRPLEQAEHLLKSLRLRGIDEEELRRFVCQNAGDPWEEFFEALFGYDRLVEARQQWAYTDTGPRRPRFALWRDPLVRWIDGRLRLRRARRDRQLLVRAGQQDLEARGVSGVDARRQAAQAADDLLRKSSSAERERITAQPPEPPPLRVTPIAPLPANRQRPRPFRNRFGGLLKPLLATGPRAPAGLLLLFLCGLWAVQNDLVPPDVLDNPFHWKQVDASKLRPLAIPFVPEVVLRPFNSLNLGVAGLVLLLSLLWPGWRMNLLVVPVAAVILLGEACGMSAWNAPIVGTLPPDRVSLVVGLGLLLVGFLFEFLGSISTQDRIDD